MTRDDIIEMIFTVFDQLMEQSDDLSLEKSVNSPLAGEGSALDSLGLVNFIVALEQKLHQELDTSVTIADPELIVGEAQPLKSVGALADFLTAKLQTS